MTFPFGLGHLRHALGRRGLDVSQLCLSLLKRCYMWVTLLSDNTAAVSENQGWHLLDRVFDKKACSSGQAHNT